MLYRTRQCQRENFLIKWTLFDSMLSKKYPRGLVDKSLDKVGTTLNANAVMANLQVGEEAKETAPWWWDPPKLFKFEARHASP